LKSLSAASNIGFAQAGQTIKLHHFIIIVLQLMGLTISLTACTLGYACSVQASIVVN
jgi:hypothetical protein